MFTHEQSLQLADLFSKVSHIFTEVANNAMRNTVELPEETVKTIKEVAKVIETPVVKEVEEVVESVQQPLVVKETTEEDLSNLKIAELRKMAKELGLDTKGTKALLIERIEEYYNGTDVEVIEEEVEMEEPMTEVVLEDEEDEVEEEVETTLADRIEAELSEMEDDDLKEILESVELSTKGKRTALISRIVDAVEQGLLDFEDEESEDEDDITEEDLEDEEIEIEDEEEIELDIDEDEDEEDEESSIRENVMEAIADDMRKQYAKKKITDKQISTFLDEYSNGTFKAKDKKRALDKYIEIHTELVDDDGDVHDLEDPYYVNEVPCCCASELDELENGNLYCQVCGNEYDTSEE